MSNKRLNFVEKKARMLRLFHEKKEFFQLKELEKIAPKEKGITENSVEEIVQALVDDGVVDTDTIEGSTYFWSFQSKVLNRKKRKLEELQSSFDATIKKLKSNSKTLSKAKEGKENIDEINKILQEIKKLNERKEQIQRELDGFSSIDPQKLKKMETELPFIKDAANRWTENIFTARSWCIEHFLTKESIYNSYFQIKDDFDYLR